MWGLTGRQRSLVHLCSLSPPLLRPARIINTRTENISLGLKFIDLSGNRTHRVPFFSKHNQKTERN